MTTCPRCRQPIRYERFGIYLPKRKSRIVDAIAAAGEVGINVTDLITAAWGADGAKPHCVNAHVRQINAMLDGSGVRIHRDQAQYYLTRARAAA